MPDRGRERDLVMAPNEFAFISDETKGNINVYVGPHKTSLANTDQPVFFDPKTKKFVHGSLETATQIMSIAPEGWYLTLKNPAVDTCHPRTGALNNLPELNIGRKVNIPGPVSFALWPGQMVRVLQGHHLRSNQYLLVRVYDEEAAKENWKNAVIKPAKGDETEDSGVSASGDADTDADADAILQADRILPELTMGKVLVIRGTDVAFYIPPTGVEVVPDAERRYVREAVTLERLEYCILLDEDGNKRYIQGPAVVFPSPSERFVSRQGSRKFRAIELNENSGLYLKVITPFEENGRKYKTGEELFITGRDQMIYFPRPEHAIIKYSDQEKHHAIAIPVGEARYVLNRENGQITLQRGPCMFLPDPRTQVIVRRVLDTKLVNMLFPGNKQAVEYNQMLSEASGRTKQKEFIAERELESRKRSSSRKRRDEAAAAPAPSPVPGGFAGDDFTRKQTFTGPRTIVLDTRYDGAVSIAVWTGYAVLVVNKSGERRVVSGPHTHLLEYDETLQVLELSTGTPKNDDKLLRTAYLRVLNNKVSDIVEVETKDLVRVGINLSYRVNFDGDPNIWFNVENYVKFLTDHLRSVIRNAVKQLGIEAFYSNAISILRDVILGKPGENGKRRGRLFKENGMRVYDVEVLGVKIGDDTIAELLVEAQHAAVQQTLALAGEKRRLEFTRQNESIAQEIGEVKSETKRKDLARREQEVGQELGLKVAELAARTDVRKRSQQAELDEQKTRDAIHNAELARKKATHDLENELAQRELAARLEELAAEVQAVVNKAGAVSPDLIAALQAFGDRALAEKMAESMAPLAILGGESVSEVLARLLRGTPLSKYLPAAAAASDDSDD